MAVPAVLKALLSEVPVSMKLRTLLFSESVAEMVQLGCSLVCVVVVAILVPCSLVLESILPLVSVEVVHHWAFRLSRVFG